MSLEVELYMSNVIKFFNENPKDLMNFVTQDKKDEFFQKIKEKALENVEKGEETWIREFRVHETLSTATLLCISHEDRASQLDHLL